MSKGFGRKGQATTEMAILGTILLLAFSGMLKWGQLMNKQQEISMLNFRKALHKAYNDYEGGDGYGGTSYRMIKHARTVEPFNKYYTGSQRQRIGAANSILWDPDLLYIKEGDDEAKPITYYNVDGDEHDELGKDAKIWDVVTNTVTHIEDLRLERKTVSQGTEAADYVSANIYEDRTTIIKTENKGDIPIYTQEDYSIHETWTTPW